MQAASAFRLELSNFDVLGKKFFPLLVFKTGSKRLQRWS